MKQLLRNAPSGEAGIRELATLVAPASDDTLEAWMAEPRLRREILDLIYESAIEMLGTELLDCDDEVIHWHVGGSPGGGYDSFQLLIEGGVVLPSRCLTRMPHVSFEIGSVELLRMAAGQVSLSDLLREGEDAVGGDWPFASQVEALFAG